MSTHDDESESGWNQQPESGRQQQPSDGGWGQPGGGWDNTTQSGTQTANVGKRIGAFVIDWILYLIVSIIVSLPFGVAALMGAAAQGEQDINAGVSVLSSLISLAIGLAYFTFMEGRNGQTLAKMMLSIKTVRTDGAPMDPATAFRRVVWFFVPAIVGLVPFLGGLLSFFVFLGVVIWLLVTTVTDQPGNRGFHDKFSGTRVVEAR